MIGLQYMSIFTKKIKIKNKFKKILFVLFLIFIDAYISAGLYFQIKPIVQEALRPRIIVIGSASASHPLRSENEVSPEADKAELPSGVSNQQIYDKIRQVFGDEWKTALAVAKCESQMEADRIGDTHLPAPSIGIFQINLYYHPQYSREELLNPDRNIEIAKEIRDKGGWNRWSCYRFNFYQKYL